MPQNRKGRLTPPPSPEATPYEVGYRKPPVEPQFKPGCSGNPKGRPKGARNKLPALHEERLKTIIIAEAYRTIKVSEGKRQITIPMAQAVVRAVGVNAARGQHRSQLLFAELVSEVERANFALWDEYVTAAIEYKHGWEQELERRERLGLTGPEPLPHPDNMVIDTKTCRVIVKGPSTKEEKARYEELWARVEECDQSIAEMTASLKERKNKPLRSFIENEIAHETRIRDIIVKGVGEPRNRNRR
jgi:Family of unknown function (DUF5681)